MELRQVAQHVAPLFRKYTPGFYDFTVRQLSSDAVRTLRSMHSLPREEKLILANAPRFAVDIGVRCGLGGLLSTAVGVLAYCDEQKLLPRLRFTNPLYAVTAGEDWLDRYFERRGKLCPEAEESPLSPARYLPKSINLHRRLQPVYARLSIAQAHDLFFASLNFRRELIEETEAFCLSHGVDEKTIGVHYRGTDKRLEATTVAWAEIADCVEACLQRQQTNIFVATDEPRFLTYMVERFGSGRVVDLGCREIFSGAPAHYSAGDPAVKASEAIRTILTLSRCGLLIRTRSHLSAWAKIVKPFLPLIVFGTMRRDPDSAFPEYLLETEDDALCS